METPGKKPKKSMYYKMMRKAGLKKKMETDPTQWAQETPAPPSKSGAKYMAMGDVVRTEGHGGGVAADALAKLLVACHVLQLAPARSLAAPSSSGWEKPASRELRKGRPSLRAAMG